jgi:ribonuclease P protein component
VKIKGVKGRKALLKVKASKQKYKCCLFSARILKEQDFSCTICITKKTGNAVCRNKIRRWFRTAFQEQYKIHSMNLHIFLFVLPIPFSFTYNDVKAQTEKFFIYLHKHLIS